VSACRNSARRRSARAFPPCRALTPASARDPQEWFQVVKDNERVICHFYRPSTWRCQLVDKHLALLAAKHLEAKFIKLDAEKSPFLAERLQIVVLPTIVCTKDNFTLDTVEGFTELGNTDEFTTETLEKRLALKGAILYDGGEPAKTISKFSMNTVRDNKQGRAVYQSKSAKQGGGGDEDSDDSWDDSDSDNE
jgi:thioredoxin-like negative regulator of GroEL